LRAIDRVRQRLAARRLSLLYLLGLAAVLVAFYWPAATLQAFFHVGDIYRLNYPLRAVYAAGLRQGRVSLWAPDVLGGYPILADGQTGAFYPLNLVLHRLLPVPVALNYSILLSLWIAGAGLFAYLRSLGVRHGPAFLGGCILMLSGFLTAHMNHVNILAGVAWLPLLLWAVERATRAAGWRAWALVAVLFAFQGLAGHPQVLVLAALPALAQAAVGPLDGVHGPLRLRRQARQSLLCCGALAAGGLLALVQLAPTYQLMRLSQRELAPDYGFFTGFSLPPAELILMLSPFRRGNPYPLLSSEIIGYVGALPLALAVAAPLRLRNRRVAFWAVMGVLAVLLALGRFNPAYRLLWYVPVLNRFRAPARNLLWLDMAVAVLAAMAVDSLLALTRPVATRRRAWLPGAAALLLVVPGLWLSRIPLEPLLQNWRWLPWVWLGLAGAVFAALLWRPPAGLWLGLAAAVVLADLGAFAGVYGKTYNDVMPGAEFTRVPHPVRFLQADAGSALYRVYTSEHVTPNLAVMRDSLFPNIQVLHGVQSLNGYLPLIPGPQQWLIENLDTRVLDLLAVRYVLVPQELPEDEPPGLFVTKDPFAPSLAGRRFVVAGGDGGSAGPAVAGQRVAAVEVEGFLLHSANLPRGTPVGQVILRSAAGTEGAWTLRAGMELADWAGAPGDGGDGPAAIREWPVHFDLPGNDTGHTYLARHVFSEPLTVEEVKVRTLVPLSHLRLERLRLIDPAGQARSLSGLAGLGNHVLVYCSPGVAIYRNESAGPRAFLVHRAQVAPSEEEARQMMADPAFDLWGEVVLTEGQALAGATSEGDQVVVEAYEAERVRVRAVTAQPAYLVLADSYYPGWQAWVDGRSAPVLRSDVALRAVALVPGEHVVEFRYAPANWRLEALVSAVGWSALAVMLALQVRRRL
jgi:hypothetical protein